MKYLVMECHDAFAVLLDSDGRFVKACNKNYETGQYVTDPVLIQEDYSLLENVYRIEKRRKAVRISFAAAVLAAFLCFNIFSFVINDYMSIYISINPEIRIDINRLGFVTDIKGLNADGDALLEKCNTESRDENVLCKNIISEAFISGYLEKGGKVSVYVDSPDDKHFRKTGTQLSRILEEFTSGEQSADIEILSFSQYVFDSSSYNESVVSTDMQESISEESSAETQVPAYSEESGHRHGKHYNDDCDDDDDDFDDMLEDFFENDD